VTNDPADGWVAHDSGKIWWRLNPPGGCTQFQDRHGYLLFWVPGQLSKEMIESFCFVHLFGVRRGREELQAEFAALMQLGRP